MLLAELGAAGLLLSPAAYARCREEVAAAGARLWFGEVAATVGAGRMEALMQPAARARLHPAAALPRVLGFGSLQARALCQVMGTPPQRLAAAAAAGALFNLGVVLFDYVCDWLPEQAPLLLERLGPASLQRLLAAEGPPPSTGAPVVDFLVDLVAGFFARCRALAGPSPDPGLWAEFRRCILAMHAAEAATARLRRAEGLPGLAVYRWLRTKSALPIWTMALLGLLPAAPPDPERVRRLRAGCVALGGVLWAVDDLADAAEDWEAGAWSRVWWRCPGATPAELASGPVLRDEAQRLVRGYRRAQRLLGEAARPDSDLDRCFRATLQSWVYGIQ